MPIVPAHDAIHINVPHLPPGQACGYTTGTSDIRWTAHDWAAHPGAVRIDQDAAGTDWTADVLDIERGAAVNAEAAHWYTMALRSFTAATRPGQRHPALYTSASNVTPLVNALKAGGVKAGPALWVANWNLTDPQAIAEVAAASGPYPVIGIQYASGAFYDTNVFSTTWLRAVSAIRLAPDAAPVRRILKAGETIASVAAARNTTAAHIGEVTVKALKEGDAYYTSR